MSKHAFFIGLLILAVASLGRTADFDAGLNAYHKGDYEAALQVFRPLAEQGDAIAQYRLGLMYNNGQGVSQDVAEAARWFRKAAEQGHAGAQSYLITMAAKVSPVVAGGSEPKPKPTPPRSDVHQIPLAIPPLPEQQPTDKSVPLDIPPLPEQPAAEILTKEPALPVEPTAEALPPEVTPELSTPSAAAAEISPPSIPELENDTGAVETPLPSAEQSTDLAETPPPSNVKATEITSPSPKSETATSVVTTTPKPQTQAAPKAKPSPNAKSKRKARPRSGSFRVQLASIRARSRAENLWRELQRKHRSLLSGLSLNVQRAELEQGIFHRLQAGPLSRAEAESICAALKRQNQGCLVVNR